MPQSFDRLKRRSEFLRVARARHKWAAPGLVLQAAPADTDAAAGEATATVRVGLTVSKKTGNAVVRNRAKRRMRAAAQTVMSERAMPGYDYVLIARAPTPTRPMTNLVADIEAALHRLGTHRKTRAGSGSGPDSEVAS